MYNFSPSLNLISVTSRKKLLSIATLSALALMSGECREFRVQDDY